MTTLKLTDYNVLSTGHDGGHHYVSTEVYHDGVKRKVTVFFKTKSDEQRLENKPQITVTGNLVDEGSQHSLLFLDAEIIDEL